MIQIPAGFDYTLLLSDYWFVSLPFLAIAVLFCGTRLITKAIRG